MPMTIPRRERLTSEQKDGSILNRIKQTGDTVGDRKRTVYDRLVRETRAKYRDAAIRNGIDVKDKD